MIVSTEAIVLHSRKYGDSSKIVTLYTKGFGRLSVLAKAARNTRNKFGSSLEPLSYSFISYYRKPQRDLHLLSSAELYRHSGRIFDSVERLSIGLAIAESVNRSQSYDEVNEGLFDVLSMSISHLNDENCSPFGIFIWFQSRLAAICGFGIEFPGKEDLKGMPGVQGRKVFYSPEKSAFSGSVMTPEKNIFMMDSNTYHIMRDISLGSLETAAFPEITRRTFIQASDFYSRYFCYNLEREFVFDSLKLIK